MAVTVNSATAEISDEKLERKPEEELFVLVDDDLDNDIVSTHAAAFDRVDPQLNPASTVPTSQPSAASKPSAAEVDAEQTKTEKEDGAATNNELTEKTKTSEKASPKRLVFGVRRRTSHVPLQVTTL